MLRAWAGGLAVAKPKAMPALYNAIGWIGMRWDGMAWDGMGWHGMGWDGMQWDVTGCGVMRWDRMGC